MPDRRSQLLRAAVRVLATGGSRALTHRAVDAEAGAPVGTTSNHFRSRAALVAGIADHLEQADRAFLAQVDPGALTRESLPALGVAYALAQVADPERARARLTLAVEAGADLTAQHQRLCALLTAVITEAGVDEPEATALAVVDHVDGVLLHALTIRGREVDPARLEASLRALLG